MIVVNWRRDEPPASTFGPSVSTAPLATTASPPSSSRRSAPSSSASLLPVIPISIVFFSLLHLWQSLLLFTVLSLPWLLLSSYSSSNIDHQVKQLRVTRKSPFFLSSVVVIFPLHQELFLLLHGWTGKLLVSSYRLVTCNTPSLHLFG